MLKDYRLLTKDIFTMNLHHINCFNIVFLLFSNTKISNINIGIFTFLIMAPPKKLLFGLVGQFG